MATIRIDVESRASNAQQELRRLRSEMTNIGEQIAKNNRRAVDADASQRRSIQTTNQRLRAEQGLLRIQAQRQSQLLPGLREEIRATTDAVRATGSLTRVFNNLGGVVAGVGIGVLTQRLTQFAAGTVEAAARLQGFRRGLEVVEQSNAPERLEQLIEVARLPGLNLTDLIQFSNRLRVIGLEAEQTDKLLQTVGGVILAMGGNARTAAEATLQLVQAIETNTVSLQDFRSIAQRVPGFYRAIAETHDVQASIDGFRVAVDNAGGSVADALLPVMDTLARQFGTPPADSYVVAIDELENSTLLLQAALGEALLPTLATAARGLSGFFDTVTSGIEDLQALSTATETVTRRVFDTNAAFSDRDSIVSYVQSLRNLRDAQQQLVDQAPWWQYTADATEGIAELTQWIDLYEQALAGVPSASEELRTELEATNAQYDQQRQTRIDLLSSLKEERESLFGNVNLYQDQYDANEEAIAQNRAKAQVLQNIINALDETTESEDEATESARLAAIVQGVLRDSLIESADSLARLKAEAADTADVFEDTLDSQSLQDALRANDAYYNALIRNAELAKDATETTAEERSRLDAEIFELGRQRIQARQALLDDAAAHELSITQNLREARITAAEQARAVEIAGFEDAAASGESYADQLRRLESVSQREAFADLVMRFQEQGLSFDEARAAAEPYIAVIGGIPSTLSAADRAFVSFSQNLVSGADASTSAIVTLSNALNLLGREIGGRALRINEARPDTAGSLERSALNEERYFQQNPIGFTIEDDQRRAFQQGSAFVNRLFTRQDQQAEREFNELIGNIDSGILLLTRSLSGLDGTVGGLATTLSRVDFSALLSGDPFRTVAELGRLFVDLGTDVYNRRQENLRQQEETAALVQRVIANAAADEGIQARAQTRGTDARSIVGGTAEEDFVSSAIRQVTDAISIFTPEVNSDLIQRAYQPFIDAFQSSMESAGTDFEVAIARDADPDVITRRFSDYTTSISEFYAARIREIQTLDTLFGNNSQAAIFEITRQRDQAIQQAANQQRLAQPRIGRSRFSQFQLNQQLGLNRTSEEIDDEYLATFAPDDPNRALPIRGGLPETDVEPETVAEDTLSAVIQAINDDVRLINASITGIETQIDQASDPEEIATLLDQLPELIRQKYQRLRDALAERYYAGDITQDDYSASITEINNAESADLERQSDQVLANTVRAINEDVRLINASITSLQTQIDQSNDPAEIAALLAQIPALITDKYRRLREALDEKYLAGEISVDVYNASLTEIASSESADTERQSDQVLANTLSVIDDDVQTISAGISSLENQIVQSNDPAEIASLLSRIAVQIPEIYRLRREGLQAQFDAGEITLSQLRSGTLALNTEESAMLERNSDAMLANALLVNSQAVETINTEISALENSITQSNDPAEIASLLSRIAVQIPEIYRLRREGLQAQFDAGEITLSQLQSGTLALNTEESAMLERNSDAMLANALLINTQAVEAINTEIGALENAISQSNDPAEIQSLLVRIAEQIPEIYRLRREGLQAQFDAGEITLSQLQSGTLALNTEESAMLERNSDAMLANALLVNSQAVESINTEIDNLENQIVQSNDPAEIQSLLVRIAEQIPEIYRLRREGLQAQFDAGEITLSQLRSGTLALNTEESSMLERNSDAMLANALLINTQAVEAINTEIGALENAISQSNDPQEIQRLLVRIAEQIPEIYRLRREGLQAQFDAGEITLSQLRSGTLALNTEESSMLERNSDAMLANALSILGTDAQETNNEINALNSQIESSTDPAEIQRLLGDLREAIMEKYRLQREVLQQQLDAEEITIASFNAQLGAINLQEGQALQSAGSFAAGQIDDIRSTENALIRNAIERSQFNLDRATSESDFEQRQQELLRLTNQYYDAELARINELELSEAELQDLREDNALARVRELTNINNLENEFAQERIRREQQFTSIQLTERRRLEDASVGTRRGIEDTLVEGGFGGIGIGHAQEIERLLSTSIENLGADAFIRDLNRNVSDVLSDFGSTFLGVSFNQEDLENFRSIGLDLARNIQDIDRDTGRSEADLLNQIASEEANNQWKSDIAAIAANTAIPAAMMGGPTEEEMAPLMQQAIEAGEMTVETVAEPISREILMSGTEFRNKINASADFFAAGVEAATTAMVNRLSSVSRGGGGGQPITLQFPSGAIFEVGNTLAEGTQTGEFGGIDSPGGSGNGGGGNGGG